MERALMLLSLLLLLPALGRSEELAPRTLSEVFESALRHSEAIAVSQEAVRAAEALHRSALGGSFPELSLRESLSKEDGGASVSEGSLRLAKTGLGGYRELAALRTAKAAAGQLEELKKRAEQLLLADVAGAFYGLLQAREDVASTQRVLQLAERRLAEVEERVRIGRSREADAVGQRFQQVSLRSQLRAAARRVGARSELLDFLAGTPVPGPIASAEPERPQAPVEDYLARLSERPDVRAAERAVQAAEGRLRLARADRLPELDLRADYYLHRPSSRDDEAWDASATLSVPVFSWGASSAAEEAARSGRAAQELALRAARRLAAVELRNAHRDLAAARRELELQKEAAALARRDYELQTRDEKRGLVTSLEVLESLNRLNDAELARSIAQLNARLAALSLELAAGAEPRELAR